MSPRSLAGALALSRLAFGVAFIAVPPRAASEWIGARAARRPATKVFTRGLGARELGLAGGALASPARGEDRAAGAWMAANAVADGVDLGGDARGAKPPASLRARLRDRHGRNLDGGRRVVGTRLLADRG